MSLQQQLTSYFTSDSGVPSFPGTGGGGGGGGVTGLLGNASGSIATTVTVPLVTGSGNITCTTGTGGLTVAPSAVQYYAGPTAEQTLTNGGGDLSFSIPLTTVAGGTYAVTCLMNFKSNTLVFPAASIATITTVTMNLTNLLSGANGRFVQQTIPVGLFNLAGSYPSEYPISLSGTITGTLAQNIGIYVSAETPPPAGQDITVFVSAVTIQRLS